MSLAYGVATHLPLADIVGLALLPIVAVGLFALLLKGGPG